MDLTTVFVRNLKKWRKNMGLSQKTLAERCNAAHSYIRQIESGKGHPSFVFIEKLALALDIEPYKLFYDKTEAKSGKLSTHNHVETIKREFIDKVANEFDTAIEQLNKTNGD